MGEPYSTERTVLIEMLPRVRLRRHTDRLAIDSTFLSQLLAERHHLPPQSEHDRAPVQGALSAYSEGRQRAIRRMPIGYRTSRSV